MNQLKLRSPPGVLEKILCQKQVDVMARQAQTPVEMLQDRLEAADPVRDFEGALREEGIGLIAEFKPKSPSKGAIRAGATVEEIAPLYAPYASAISCLTDASFFGSNHENLTAIRGLVPQPVLCKDFIVSKYQILEARVHNADAVLLMACLLPPKAMEVLLGYTRELGMEALVEVHTLAELQGVLRFEPKVLGVNARDLTTLKINLETSKALLKEIPDGIARVAESGLDSAASVAGFKGLADAALIGSALMAAEDPAAAIEALGWKART